MPVSFAEIQRVAAIGEIMRLGDVIPDVSLGSHFFNDLVEAGMLYVALYPTHPGHRLDEARLRAAPSRLAELLPDDARLANVVRVVDFPLAGDGRALWLNADCVRQAAICYLRAALIARRVRFYRSPEFHYTRPPAAARGENESPPRDVRASWEGSGRAVDIEGASGAPPPRPRGNR